MLEIRQLDVSYGPVLAVRGIDLSVTSGEVVALIGPNGAGKTSTLRAISGLVPHGGTVTFDGHDCRSRNIEGLARLGLIHVPEGRHVFPSLDVHENLQLGTTAAAGRSDGFTIDDVYDLFTPLQDLRHRATGGRCRVANSRWSRSVVRSWPSHGCCCSTSRRWGCRPSWSPWSTARARAGVGPDSDAPGRTEHRASRSVTARGLR